MACTSFSPNLQPTGITRCQKTSNGNNTGYQEQQFQDTNPCSPTYLQTSWSIGNQTPSTCPVVANCSGNDKRVINGVCETGMMVVTGSALIDGVFTCVYHYEWSDGFWSPNYTGNVIICAVE